MCWVVNYRCHTCMYVCSSVKRVLYCKTVSTSVLCTCVRQARRQLKQVPLAFVLMTFRWRVVYVRVLHALLDAFPQFRQSSPTSRRHSGWPSETSFLASLSVGSPFHFSQAVWRNVQSVGLQLAYAKDDSINRVCHKTQAQALCFLPADAIGDEFGKLEQVAAAGGDTRVQEHPLSKSPTVLL